MLSTTHYSFAHTCLITVFNLLVTMRFSYNDGSKTGEAPSITSTVSVSAWLLELHRSAAFYRPDACFCEESAC